MAARNARSNAGKKQPQPPAKPSRDPTPPKPPSNARVNKSMDASASAPKRQGSKPAPSTAKHSQSGSIPAADPQVEKYRNISEALKDKTQQLETVTQELRTKQRILGQLKDQTAFLDSAVTEEISARDRQIEQLNQQIINLKTDAKESSNRQLKERSNEIEKLKHENITLNNENHKIEANIAALEARNQENQQQFDQQRDEMIQEQNILKEQLIESEGNVQTNNKIMEESRNDMKNLSQIVADMTRLNNELNEKVTSLNDQMEQTNAENFKLKKKADISEDLEKNLEEQVSEGNNLIKQVKKLNTMVDFLKNEKIESEKCYNAQQDVFKAVEAGIRKLGQPIDTHEVIEQITSIRHAFKVTIAKPLPQDFSSDDVNLKDELNSVKALLMQKDREVRELRSNSKVLQSRVNELERNRSKQAANMADAEAQKKVIIDRLNEEISRLKSRVKTLHTESTHKDQAISKADNQMIAAQARNQALKKQMAETQQRLVESESALKQTRDKFLKIQTEKVKSIKELQTREARIRKTALLLKTYEEEVYNKDTQILKIEAQQNGQLQQIEDLKAKNSQLNAKMKTIVAQELESANKQLEEKDSEIKVLNEMVRSTQIQLKSMERNALTVRRSEALVSPSPEPSRGARDDALFSILNNFAFQAKDIKRWEQEKAQKLKGFQKKKSGNMPVADLRQIFDMNFPGSGDADPQEVFKKLLNDKRHSLVTEISGKLKNIRKKISAADFLANVKIDSLKQVLGDKTNVSVAEIVTMLPKLL